MDEEKEDKSDDSTGVNKDLPNDFEEGENTEQPGKVFRRRRKVKVRKRVRVKKKSSPKKKAKKLVETAIWIGVLLAFIATLVILIKQIEIKSSKVPQKKTSELFHSKELLSLQSYLSLKS